MVVRLERWVCLLVAERVRPRLPLDPLLPFDLRRANLRHPTFCRSIYALNDAALVSDPQEVVTRVRGRAFSELRLYGVFCSLHDPGPMPSGLLMYRMGGLRLIHKKPILVQQRNICLSELRVLR